MIQTQLKRIYQYTSLTLRVRHCDEQFCIFVALLVLQAEVNYLGQFYHPHLVKLIGYCLEDEHRLLVYEFMPRGSLENHLFRSEFFLPYRWTYKPKFSLWKFCDERWNCCITGGSYFQPLSWNLRLKAALGAAKGLAFLHSAETKVIYRDFKTANILLDSVCFANANLCYRSTFALFWYPFTIIYCQNYNARLSDFGLAKDGPTGDKSHVSTRVMGTYGYAAPEYLATGMTQCIMHVALYLFKFRISESCLSFLVTHFAYVWNSVLFSIRKGHWFGPSIEFMREYSSKEEYLPNSTLFLLLGLVPGLQQKEVGHSFLSVKSLFVS